MAGWEYKVMPAPTKGVKGKGVKGPEARFANALEVLMNDMAGDGWEFQRAETLPSIERSGLTGSTTEWRNVLVFRRAVTEAIDDFAPELLPAPSVVTEPEEPEAPAAEAEPEPADAEDTAGRPGATQMLADNGVEETSEVSGMTTSLQKLASRRSGTEMTDG
ncbi:MAG: DUF4177 domain-containing protein [Pseudomonadota bacterium]